ncbi:MAG: TRAP transporter permease, partial [Gammaproteobacteria bacterium]
MFKTGWNHIPESVEAEVFGVRENRLVYILGIAIAALHFWFNSFGAVDTHVQNIVHFAGFALLCGLIYPISRNPFIRTIDIAFMLAVVCGALFLIVAEDMIYARGVKLEIQDWIIGTIVILGAIEFTRRSTGWIIPALIIIALSYITWWGNLIDGVFSFGGLSLETTMFRSLFGDDALFGNIARISATFVFMFILFGAFLLRSGAGDFVIHLSRAVAGRMIGGPGIVAVIASGLTGTISGSAIANTASTGVITIPMMKKAGFPAKFAAGIEASASTGGQLMPPVMGAVAFIMADFLARPYRDIVIAALVPSFLYYVALFFQADLEAARRGIARVEGQFIPGLLS